MLENFYRINQAVGVNINIANDGSVSISACSITVQNERLSIDKKESGLKQAGSLKDRFPAKMFVALNLSGKGILYKHIELTEKINADSFNKVLPNGNIADFYVQNFISGGHSFVSVIRKTDADHWVAQLAQVGFATAMLSLGPFPVQHVLPQLNFYDRTVIFNGFSIERSETGEWIGWNFNESARAQFPIKLESETISESLIIPYAVAFQLVLSDKLEPVQAESDILSNALHNNLKQRKLKAQGGLILAICFLLLLVNFGLLSWLKSSNEQLSEQVSRTAQNTDDMSKISDEIQQKEGLLKTLGWENGVNKSALVDQLTSLLPPEIQLKEMTVDPMDIAGSRQQKAMAFFTDRIRITGTSEKIIPVNEWIARIKTKKWVKNVQMDNYTFNSELNTGQFTVLVDY